MTLCWKIHYPQSMAVFFYKFFKLLCSMLRCGIHCNGSFVTSLQQFLTNLRNVEPLNFFPVGNTDANPILHRKSPVSGDLRNKSVILFSPWATMGRALEHDPATALFHPVYTAQNRLVLRTKSTVSRIFATLQSLCWLPCFCV